MLTSSVLDPLQQLSTSPTVALIANKLAGDAWTYDEHNSPVLQNLNDVLQLGLGEPIPISALPGNGMADPAILIEQLKDDKRQQALLLLEHNQKETMSDLSSFSTTTNWEGDSFVSTSLLDDEPNNNIDKKPLQVAIIGRQNVGKSTLVNTLVQSNRVLTGSTPGLTRDAIAVQWKMEDGQVVQLVDTAGIRKMTKRIDDSIEYMSVADSLRVMKVAEVVV